MNVLRQIFLNSRKERRKDGKSEFFVRCRRTYVLNKPSFSIGSHFQALLDTFLKFQYCTAYLVFNSIAFYANKILVDKNIIGALFLLLSLFKLLR